MKKISILILLILSTVTIAFSQTLTVDCGEDLNVCVPSQTDVNLKIGSNVRINQGTAPYIYEWTCNYQVEQTYFSASTFLSDTSALTPYFKDFPSSNGEKIVFKLSVKDHAGNKATDSLTVYFYKFSYLLSDPIEVLIKKGDSVQLSQTFISGGLSSLTYYWTPITALSNSSGLNTWANPEVPVEYAQFVIDSLGCISDTVLTYRVQISTNNESLPYSTKKIKSYQQGMTIHFDNPTSASALLSLYTLDGKKILELKTRSSEMDLSGYALKNNMYIYWLKVGKDVESGKFLKMKNEKK